MSKTWSEIIPPKCHIEPIEIPSEFLDDPVGWLARKAKERTFRWLLAHAHDGVIWGELRGETLHLSTSISEPVLREKTLQDLRLFGEKGELFAWRNDNTWLGRIIQDHEEEIKDVDYHDEPQLLWGDHESDRNDSFVLLHEGTEGMRHAPPVVSNDQITQTRRMHLMVRHYFGTDGDGQMFIACSRLVALLIKSKGES